MKKRKGKFADFKGFPENPKSEFNSSALDLQRIASITDVMTEYSIAARSYNMKAIRPFFACVQELYNHLKPVFYSGIELKGYLNIKDEIQTELTRINHKINEIIRENDEEDLQPVLDDLDNVLGVILFFKQKAHLGIATTPTISKKTRQKRGMGDYSD